MKPVRPQKYSPLVEAPPPPDAPTVEQMKRGVSDAVKNKWATIEQAILDSREPKASKSGF